MKIFDTHVHLYFPVFSEKLNQVVSDCEFAGVTHQLQIGCDEISCLAALNLARKYSNFYCALGLHPCDVDKIGQSDPVYHCYDGLEDYVLKTKTAEEFFIWLEELFLAHQDKVVAFGETGFDLHHRHTSELYEIQKSCFRSHLKLCEKYDKALVVHTRSAAQQTLEFLNQEKPQCRGVIHAFSEGSAFAREVTTKHGFYLGIGGVATYPKMRQVREAIVQTPIEFLLTETDSPFLTPRNTRNSGVKSNSPQYLPEVIRLIAELKNLPLDECADQLFKNAEACFGLTA